MTDREVTEFYDSFRFPADSFEQHRCPACGYRESTLGNSADNAHDDLCCGTAVCSWTLCLQHLPPLNDASR